MPPSACPRHVRIKNWGSGMTFQDTLHHKAKGVRGLGLRENDPCPKLVKPLGPLLAQMDILLGKPDSHLLGHRVLGTETSVLHK